MDEMFKALGNPTRLRIIRMLAEQGEVCVCKIVDAFKINQSAVSHHMGKLKQAGLVHHRKDGQWIYYSLNTATIDAGPLAFLAEAVSMAKDARRAVEDSACCE